MPDFKSNGVQSRYLRAVANRGARLQQEAAVPHLVARLPAVPNVTDRAANQQKGCDGLVQPHLLRNAISKKWIQLRNYSY